MIYILLFIFYSIKNFFWIYLAPLSIISLSSFINFIHFFVYLMVVIEFIVYYIMFWLFENFKFLNSFFHFRIFDCLKISLSTEADFIIIKWHWIKLATISFFYLLCFHWDWTKLMDIQISAFFLVLCNREFLSILIEIRISYFKNL